MAATRTITVEYDLPYPPAKVWRALTEPALLEKWLMPGDIAPIVGHKFTMHTAPMGDWDGTIYCEVLTVEVGKRLAYSWKGGNQTNKEYGQPLNTVATWTLSEKPDGTLLLLEHSGFREQDEFAFTVMGSGWTSHCGGRLQAALATMS
jgi:uncharacterized protein YndB with AHSA1/START domain